MQCSRSQIKNGCGIVMVNDYSASIFLPLLSKDR